MQGKLFSGATFGDSDLPLRSDLGAYFSGSKSWESISFRLKIETLYMYPLIFWF